MRRARLSRLACLLPLAAAAPAAAHPHVFVAARAEIVFAPDGKVTAVRHRWTFDEGWSSVEVQGRDANGDGRVSSEELAETARTVLTFIAEFGYFTQVKAFGAKQGFGRPTGERMSYENGRLSLEFDLPLATPAPGKLVVLDVYDPTFYVAFAAAEEADALKLAGAPAGCVVKRPTAAPKIDAKNLSETFFQSLNAASTFGSQFSNRAMVACP